MSNGMILIEDLSCLDRNSICKMINEKRMNNKYTFIIFPHEWAKRHKQIESHLGSYSKKLISIYARKCEVKKIESRILRDFCNQYHIQGANKLSIAGWGIFYNEKLAGILSLGRHNRDSEAIVLDRLCFHQDYRVVGGSSKLFSHALKWAMEKGIEEIISFSDNRWSLGDVYANMGFKLEKELPPDYFYVDKNDYTNYFSKQSQKKSNTNCPSEITEKKWAEMNGLIQVYDAGKKRWVYKIRLIRKINTLSFRKHGYYKTKKAGVLYYQSSYELKAMTILDEDENVKFYTNQIMFFLHNKKRYIDFLVTYKDGSKRIIETKPIRTVASKKEQIEANKEYATKQGWGFSLWCEKELQFKSEHFATKWADQFLSTITGVDYVEERKKKALLKVKKYYDEKVSNNKVKVYCEYCKDTHEILALCYNQNLKRNGRYICHTENAHKPKPPKRIENPHSINGEKKCVLCKEVKPFTEFGKDKSRIDGYASRCRGCRNNEAKNKYKLNKESRNNNVQSE